MDALAVKQACKFAKEHALNNGPIVSSSVLFLFTMNQFYECNQYAMHVTGKRYQTCLFRDYLLIPKILRKFWKNEVIY